MHYTISKINSTTRYKYTFEDNTSCMFSVSKGGIIYIDIKQYIPFEFICSALNEVSDIIAQQGIVPKININNSNDFLKVIAKKCKYKKTPSRGISFSVWSRPIKKSVLN